ncbi:MAG: hypothetical protein VR65_17765 [Desulfobulbaceae bacterium BRH_c16a]|nr:MAG: hypothetical protein VR65_17765 [Desulfobulbaceae bacterium BRH_c16a]
MKIIGVVLGGGTGSRLKPLTVRRAKPAVPLAGNYRLVDVPISNCINSSIFKIYLLTQYKSASLHHHIQSTYQFDQFSKGFVQLLAAEQTPESKEWFQGTADAVRQSMHYLASSEPDLVVILSGDQLFRIDFQLVIAEHVECNADVTVCTTPVAKSEAADLGIVQVNGNGRIGKFVEKPGLLGLTAELCVPLIEEKYLASMGIYVFNFAALTDLLEKNPGADFGHHIIPEAIHTHRVFSYIFDGYWKDIGTIGSFWQANLELTGSRPRFSLYDADSPIYTRPRFLPPSQIHSCIMKDCLVSEGVTIDAAKISRSVVGLRSVIRSGSTISESIVMGNDFFEPKDGPPSGIPLGIGRNCRIERAIIDKNVRIGDNVSISPYDMEELSTDLYTVRDGIIVIPKGVNLPANTVIGTHSGVGVPA